MSSISAEERGLFWEVSAGQKPLSNAFSYEELVCVYPIDAASIHSFNILDPCLLSIVIGLILECRCMVVGITPPFHCVLQEDPFLYSSLAIVKACSRAGCHVFLTMPRSAREWFHDVINAELTRNDEAKPMWKTTEVDEDSRARNLREAWGGEGWESHRDDPPAEICEAKPRCPCRANNTPPFDAD